MRKFVKIDDCGKKGARRRWAAWTAALVILAAIFAACSGLAGDSGSSSQDYAQTSSSNKNLITFRGTVGIQGAVPQEIAPAAMAQGSGGASKTADPTVTISATECYYFVTAEPINGNTASAISYGKDDTSVFKKSALWDTDS